MNRSTAIAAFIVSTMLGAPALAQQEQNRGQTPQAQPPAAQTPAPAANAPVARPPPSPAEVEAQRRRAERTVELDELVARVAETTGKKFLVDPRVRAQVNAIPRIDNPTYAELLTILQLHGFAAAEVEGRVVIVPDANARFLPTRVLQRDDDSVPDDEFVTRILTVPDAAQLVAVLRPLMPQSAHLASVGGGDNQPNNDKLILMDTYGNIRRMTEIINTLTR